MRQRRHPGRAGEPQAPALPGDHGGKAVLCLGFGLIGLCAFHQVGGLDEGFHLRAGNYILDGHGWPRNDPFTYTLNIRPYVDTSWGYQVLLAVVQRAFDAPGMVALNVTMILAVFLCLVRTARLRAVSPTVLVLLLPLSGIASQIRFEIRPEILSYLLLALVVHLMTRYTEGKSAPPWQLPLVFLIWGNCHAFFVLGWAALACFLAGIWLRDRRVNPRFALYAGLSILAPFINPYGWKGVIFPLGLLTRFQGGNPFAQSIEELLSPFSPKLSEQYAFFPVWSIYAYRALAGLSLVALRELLRQRVYPAVLLWLVFLPLSASMTRNMPLLVIACLPGMTWGLSSLANSFRNALGQNAARRCRLALRIGIASACVLCGARVITNAYYIGDRREQRTGWGWNRRILPVDAAEYVRRVGLAGPMLNHISFGGYLMWALSAPVFVDARLEVVGEQFFDEYSRIMASKEAMDAAVDRYRIEWIIFPYVANPRLTNRLSSDPAWRLAYFDHVAAVFVRNRPGAERFIDASAAALAGTPPAAVPIDSLPGFGGRPRLSGIRRWLEGFIYLQHYPADEYHRGLFHLSRNELAWAEASLTAGIVRSEGAYFELYRSLGAILQHTGRPDAARRCFEIVLEDRPEDELAAGSLRAVTSVVQSPERRG